MSTHKHNLLEDTARTLFVTEQTALSAAEQARVEAEMKEMARRKEGRRRSHLTGIDPTSPRYAGRRNEAGVRSNPDFDPTAPGAKKQILIAQVRDSLEQVRNPKYGSATHPSRTGTRGSTYQDTTQGRFGVNFQDPSGRRNPQRETAIQNILNQTKDKTEVPDVIANLGRPTFKNPKGGVYGQSQIDPETGKKDTVGAMRRRQLDAMSDEELQGAIDQQISRDNAAELKAISDKHAEKGMKKYGIEDRDVYDERYKNYQDAMKAERDAYRDDPKTHQYEDDIEALRGQRSSARGEERYAINRQIAQRKREESRRRRGSRPDKEAIMTDTQTESNEHYFPTSPSEFVTMLREQYK
jgi:hypothetical protein